MIDINITTTLLENINTIAQVVIALCALIALSLIAVAKRDIKTRSQRESATSALQKLEKFPDLLDSWNEFNVALAKNTVAKYTGECDNFIATEKNKEWSGIKNVECYYLAIALANDLEAFSAYFIHGVADEKIAFTPISIEFCNMVKDLYPYISSVRDNKKHNFYKNLIQLYKIWSKKLKNKNTWDKILTSFEEIWKLLKGLEKNPPKTKPPIGT